MIFNVSTGEVKTLPIASDKFPEDITVKAGENAVFSAVIEKDGVPTEYTYKWYVDNSLVSDATTAVYTRKTDSDIGVYTVYCEITNKAGFVKTRSATLTVNKLPKLDSTKPENSTVYTGVKKTFNVNISEHGYPRNYTYQWYANGSKISGANGPSYDFTPTKTGTTNLYCTVTNDAGTVTSRTSTITTYYLVFDRTAQSFSSISNGLHRVWSTSPAVADANPYIKIYTNSGSNIEAAYQWKTAIDFSKYNKLIVTGYTTNTNATFGICGSLGPKLNQVTNVASKAFTKSNSDLVLDVSGISIVGYIGFYAWNKGSSTFVKSVKLI